MDLSPSRRLLATPVALVAWFALGLQLFLVVRAVPPGDALLPAVGRFFSYFTVLNNLLVALVATGVILSRSWRKPALEAATAVYIFMVGVLYSLLLRHIWAPTGWQKVADGLLHDVVPVLFVVWWLFDARTRLAWRNVALYLLWPLLYLAITLVDGALTGWYPYAFVDAAALGYSKVLGIAATLTVFLAVVGSLAIAWSRWRSGNASVG